MATVAQAFDAIRNGKTVNISDPNGIFTASDLWRKNGNIYAYNPEIGQISLDDWDLDDLIEHFLNMGREGFTLSIYGA